MSISSIVLSLAASAGPLSALATLQSAVAPDPASLMGQGPGMAAIACATCVGGGVAIALGGWGAVLVASLRAHSLGVLWACGGSCLTALGVL